MTIEFAVNYSHPAAELYCAERIHVDRFKCPAWPVLVATAQELYPVYVHFPLKIGLGIGDAMDVETGQLADWDQIETLLNQTDTQWVNLHLAPSIHDYPDIPVDSVDPAHVEMLTDHIIRDVSAVVERFGPECVVVENIHEHVGTNLRPAFLPDVICCVVEETGCGFLLDVSHARLAARCLGVDAHAYIQALPTERTCEIHITGIQRFEGRWIELAYQAGVDTDIIQHLAGHPVDHLPMADRDWEFSAWAMEQTRSGAWGQPDIVTFEYGGVGGFFAAITDADVLEEQVPRLYAQMKGWLCSAPKQVATKCEVTWL
jgi:uncharacterized protein (UPF0276 family)